MKRLALVLIAALLALPTTARAQRYLAFGDSITNGTGETDPNENGYPSRLQKLLRQSGQAEAVVVPFGVGGETTAEGLSRINSVLNTGGDFIFIMEGTNDILRNISVRTTTSNLEKMVDRSLSAGVSPIWASVIPLRPNALTEDDAALAVEIRQRSLARSLTMVDNYAVYDYAGAWPELYNRNLNPDPVGHPNGQGYALMASTFADVVNGVDSLPPVLGNVTPPDGSEGVSRTTDVTVVVFDLEQGIDVTSTTMIVNGETVAATRGGGVSRSTYVYSPAAPLPNSVEVEMNMLDLAGNSVRVIATRFVTQGSTFFPGDINRDGRVDGKDLVFFAFSFGSNRGSNRYRAENDLNSDGFVGGADLAILASNFGKGA